jgi:rare lipoprotein A
VRDLPLFFPSFAAVVLSVALLVWLLLRPLHGKAAPLPGIAGFASWYGEGYRGKTMANGQPFDPEEMTCAAWHWPLGTLLRVQHIKNGRYVIVEVTDRGPAKWTKRLIDLSARSFRRLEAQDVGIIPVRVEVLRLGKERVHP